MSGLLDKDAARLPGAANAKASDPEMADDDQREPETLADIDVQQPAEGPTTAANIDEKDKQSRNQVIIGRDYEIPVGRRPKL